MSIKTLFGWGALCLGLSLILPRVAPRERLVLFPAPGVQALAVDDSLSGGHSWAKLQAGLSSVELSFGLKAGAPYPHAGLKFLVHSDLSRAEALEIHMRADSGVAMRVALKSPAPELGRPEDPSAMFYHEMEYAPWGADTLRLVPVGDLRMPSWWRIREGWPRDQELERLGEVTEVEIMNGFAQVARDSVHAQVHSVVAISRPSWQNAARLLLGLLALGCWGLALWRWTRKAPPVADPVASSLPWSAGARPLVLPDPGEEAKERLLAHLREHYAESDYSLSSLAKGVGMGERAASEALSAATGTHFKAALNELRLGEAARLLGQKRNVSEVAYAVGFQNPSHFARAFKARFGVTPSEYGVSGLDKSRSEA